MWLHPFPKAGITSPSPILRSKVKLNHGGPADMFRRAVILILFKTPTIIDPGEIHLEDLSNHAVCSPFSSRGRRLQLRGANEHKRRVFPIR